MADELEHGLGDYLLATQAKRIRELEAALKPFADLADHPLNQGWEDWQPLWRAGYGKDDARIMFSDIRKARDVLRAQP